MQGSDNFVRTYKQKNKDDVRYGEEYIPKDRKRDKKRSKNVRRLERRVKKDVEE